MELRFARADEGEFTRFRAIYECENLYMSHDWQDRRASGGHGGNCMFVYLDGGIVGGFRRMPNCIADPFLAAPYADRRAFWRAVLAREGAPVRLHDVARVDADMLVSLGAREMYAQRSMCRPTVVYPDEMHYEFALRCATPSDAAEIAETARCAHAAGYTGKVWGAPTLEEVRQAIDRRIEAFSGTDTLRMSTLGIHRDTGRIAGVCIAGIYPDSPNNFSTIHQISVRPESSGRGLAGAMMRRTISIAHAASPVIGLNVLIGNPAEHLYRKMGFAPGPERIELQYGGNGR